MSHDWLPNVVEASSSVDSVLDVTVKMSPSKDTLAVYVANLSNTLQQAVVQLNDFKPNGRANIWIIGNCDLTEYNPVEKKDNVVPATKKVTLPKNNIPYSFPRYSYTVITFSSNFKNTSSK